MGVETEWEDMWNRPGSEKESEPVTLNDHQHLREQVEEVQGNISQPLKAKPYGDILSFHDEMNNSWPVNPWSFYMKDHLHVLCSAISLDQKNKFCPTLLLLKFFSKTSFLPSEVLQITLQSLKAANVAQLSSPFLEPSLFAPWFHIGPCTAFISGDPFLGTLQFVNLSMSKASHPPWLYSNLCTAHYIRVLSALLWRPYFQ